MRRVYRAVRSARRVLLALAALAVATLGLLRALDEIADFLR